MVDAFYRDIIHGERVTPGREERNTMLQLINKAASATASAVSNGLSKMFGQENLFTRNDTIFGVCEGLGEDLGINPLFLRLAFILPLFWFPMELVMLYFGLGAILFVTRMLVPARKAEASASVTQLPEPAKVENEALPKAA